jgi:hypothetical protein
MIQVTNCPVDQIGLELNDDGVISVNNHVYILSDGSVFITDSLNAVIVGYKDEENNETFAERIGDWRDEEMIKSYCNQDVNDEYNIEAEMEKIVATFKRKSRLG